MSTTGKKRRGRPALSPESRRDRKQKRTAEYNKIRGASRVNIGNQFGRWHALKTVVNVKQHDELAGLLLDR